VPLTEAVIIFASFYRYYDSSIHRHSGMRRKAQARNLEILGSMLSHRPGMTS